MENTETVNPQTDKPAENTMSSVETAENIQGLKNALEAERKAAREARKSAKEYEAKLAELSSQSAKTSDELEVAKARIAKFEENEKLRTWKAEIASEYGIDSSILRGSAKAELEEHAKQIKNLLSAQKVMPVIPDQGRTPETPALNSTEFENALRDIVGA